MLEGIAFKILGCPLKGWYCLLNNPKIPSVFQDVPIDVLWMIL